MKRTLVGLTALGLVAGCSSAGAAHRTVLVSERDAGHVVHVERGDVVQLRLHSTYWQPAGAPGGELVETSHDVVGFPPSSQHCGPGQGCGTVRVDYRAARSGRVTLRASRTSCGEAMRCTGTSGRYAVEIVVG